MGESALERVARAARRMQAERTVLELARVTRVEAHRRRTESGEIEQVDAHVRKVLDAYGAGAAEKTRRGAYTEAGAGSGLTQRNAVGDTGGVTETNRLAGMTPVEIDTDLYALYEKRLAAEGRTQRTLHSMHRDVDRKDRRGEWELTDAETVDKIRARAASDRTYLGTNAQRDLAALEASRADETRLDAEMDTYDTEFRRRGGWTRAFLVTNGDGHVHRSMNCSTCNRGIRRTQFQWMTQWSAADEDKIVADAGWRACTVCYPSAPVGSPRSLPTRMFSAEDRAKEEAKAARDAAAAAKRAKAVASAPTASGEPLVVTPAGSPRFKEIFKTERAAMMWATDTYVYDSIREQEAGNVALIAAAIAEKRGVPVADVLAEIEAKGRKKALR